MTALLAVHAAATWALVGLIWTVQLVLYPLFARVNPDAFLNYHAQHLVRVTFVVAPLMALEVISAALLVFRGAREPWLLASFVPLFFNWISTWRVQIPLHNRLAKGFGAEAHRCLVASNWWRTTAWSIRGACVLYGVS